MTRGSRWISSTWVAARRSPPPRQRPRHSVRCGSRRVLSGSKPARSVDSWLQRENERADRAGGDAVDAERRQAVRLEVLEQELHREEGGERGTERAHERRAAH